MPFHAHLLAGGQHGTLCLGMTRDLARRVFEHESKVLPGFSRKYDVDRRVWYEEYPSAREAIDREKDIKKWRRDWKIRLIEEENPLWADLCPLLAQ